MEKAVLIASLVLVGCSTIPEQPKQPIKIVDNEKKDEYIEYVEKEVSESAAALIAVTEGVTKPYSDVLGLTVTRLAGIRQPEKEQIERFRLALKDTKVLKAEIKEAENVKKESEDLYSLVVAVDAENESLREQVKLMEAERQAKIREEAYADIKRTCMMLGGVITIAGIALAVAGSWLGRGAKQGILVFLAGMAIISAPLVIQDVVESIWFKVGVGCLFALAFGYVVWMLFHTDKEIKRKIKVVSESNAVS